ncbi:MAG: YabP/YqfC family sporulation protein [Negativibacillus sp.]
MPVRQNQPLSDFLKKEVHLEFNGNREVIIEECSGILEYTEQQVRVNTANFILRFQGKNLQIRTMTHDSIILSGHIDRLEFLF